MFAQLNFLGLFVFNPCFDSWFFFPCLPLIKKKKVSLLGDDPQELDV